MGTANALASDLGLPFSAAKAARSMVVTGVAPSTSAAM
jgi:diacylglycerol kinase family enzyme